MSLHLSPIVEALDLLDTAAAELDEQLPRALAAGQSRARLLAVLPRTKEGDPNPDFRVGGLVELGVEFADLADWRERRRTVAVVHTEAAT